MNGNISISKVSKVFRTPILRQGFRGTLQNLLHREYTSITAVDDISLDIEPGEIVGYIGPNGAGKTTTIKLLSGILHPTTGTIKVNGLIPCESRCEHTMNIGAMFGNQSRLYWNLPVQETFSLMGKLYSLDHKTCKKRIQELTGMLQIESLLPRQARTLSLGQRIRCELAASLIHSPSVIYLDEPTIGLDVAVKARVLEFLHEINHSDKKTIILTSHDVHDIETLASRITVIDSGKILFDGDVDHFKTRFGSGKKIIHIVFEQQASTETIDTLAINHNLHIETFDGYALDVTLPKDANPTRVIHAINAASNVKDMTITSEPVVDMVRRIYEN